MKGLSCFNGATLMNVAKTGLRFVEKNIPAIAAGAAIGTMVFAVIVAAKEGPKYHQAIEDAEIVKNEKALKERMDTGSDETPIVELTKKEKGAILVKHYWKAAALVAASSALMILSVVAGNRQTKAALLMLTAAETNMDNIEKAVKEVVGDKKFDSIREKVIENTVDDMQLTDGDIQKTGNGNELIIEPWFGVAWESTIAAADTAAVAFRSVYQTSGEATMDELLKLNGISEYRIPKLAKEAGYFWEPDDQIEYPPKYEPKSIWVMVNGVKRTAYIVDFGRPRRRDDLMNEQVAIRSFRQW